MRWGRARLTASIASVAFVAVFCIGSYHRGDADAQIVNATCDTATTRFCDALMPSPAGWKGPVFSLSQDYPSTIERDVYPWLQFDPHVQPGNYASAVLGYFYQGNIQPTPELSFDPRRNSVRHWYHAPWLDFGVNGREFIHGLTRERSSRPGELAQSQTSLWTNYAVGLYNSPGGVAIGRVWANRAQPNAAMAIMPEGTVAAKLLFTTASTQEVPFLAGSPEWNGYIFKDVHNDKPTAQSPRDVIPMRLLQIDIAVKDHRAAPVGWFFGTFIYAGGGSSRPGTGWANVAPVGLMWGNDPNYSGTGPLRETVLNSTVSLRHYGYQGRLNGPVDNAMSSCLSCHATAEDPIGDLLSTGTAPTARWFQNLPSGVAFDSGRASTDYSLQLAFGIANFKTAERAAAATKSGNLQAFRALIDQLQSRPPRDGGKIH